MKILFFGDIVGRAGRGMVVKLLSSLAEEFKPSCIIANVENSSGGLGFEPKTVKELFQAGIQISTSGNHVWQRRAVESALNDPTKICLRPANFPPSCPGRGYHVLDIPDFGKLGVLNLIGRVFMPQLVDCPFRIADTLLETKLKDCRSVFVDFHAEATSEKYAMLHHLVGRVAAVCGTHTHVQTADEHVFMHKTAYISDVGMSGPTEGVIGMNADTVVQRFLTTRQQRFTLSEGPAYINAVVVELCTETGSACSIQRINRTAPAEEPPALDPV